MTFYHYTPASNLESIKEKGLFHFGIGWFTTSEEPEPTVSMCNNFMGVAQGRISLKRKVLAKFSAAVEIEEDYNEFSSYMNVPMLMEMFDTNEWYFTRQKITPQAIATYEVQQEDGTWEEILKETE